MQPKKMRRVAARKYLEAAGYSETSEPQAKKLTTDDTD
jgi:hypothetical protein